MRAAQERESDLSIRSLGLPIYTPALLFTTGQGAVIPVIALAARHLGASPAFAALVVALNGIGTLAFDLPSGWLTVRLGERRAMVCGLALSLVALGGCVWTNSLVVFAAFTFLLGCGSALWFLARFTYISELVPLHLRGRALATLGGVNRIGLFLGPFIGAGLVASIGISGPYYLHLAMVVVAGLVLLASLREQPSRRAAGLGDVSLSRVVRGHRDVFVTAGSAPIAIQMLRASRQAAIPLWAAHIGLGADAASLVYGISTGIEATLFYPVGRTMDRVGRKVVAIPCLGLMSLGMIVLPLAHTFWALALVGLVMGVGNGLGSGLLQTLGADFSPVIGRAQFLSAWRLIGDLGTASGPLGLSAGAAALSLAGASALIGIVGLIGASAVLRLMPEPLHPRELSEETVRPP